jgi:hypothetical protein
LQTSPDTDNPRYSKIIPKRGLRNLRDLALDKVKRVGERLFPGISHVGGEFQG